jgi:ADP-heptose:LPS heptosyltransferase
MPQTVEKILFVELLGGIGDLVIALPAIHAVARTHPAARLTVLTFAPGAQLLNHDPLIQQVISVQPGMARQAVQQILQQAFDLIISDTNYDGIDSLIQNYQQSRQPAPHIIPNLWRSPPDQERVGQRFLNILQTEGVIAADALPTHQPEIYFTETEQVTARQQLGPCARPLVFLCPDAGMAIKRWPADRFVALGQALQQQYRATVLIPASSPLADQIALEMGGQVQVLPPGSLRQLAARIALADLVVAADTGLAHIAAALQVPTITLFGPSWAGRYGHPAPHINLQGDTHCPERIIRDFTQQRCWYSGTCSLEWQTSCLEDISVAAVQAAADPLLKPAIAQPLTQDLQPVEDFKLPDHKSMQSLNPDWQAVRNLLVMRLDNLGDVIMTSPALRAIKTYLPRTKLTLMASPSGATVAPLLPWVDQVLPWRVVWQDLGHLGFDPEREWQLIETLKTHQFDAAIIFTSFSQSPHPAGLACALAGIPLRLGESKEVDMDTLTHAIPPASDDIHQVDRNLRLLEWIGFPVENRRMELVIPATKPADPYLLLNPWTSCAARNYPTDRFAEAARQLSQQTGWPVVLTGVAKDQDRAAPLLDILGSRAVNRIGQTSLTELVTLVDQARLVLTNNTSVMHIADATQTPMVVMFAGTELESQWCPRYAPHRILRQSTSCHPCYQRICPYHLECLDIPVERVVTSALELLEPELLEPELLEPLP